MASLAFPSLHRVGILHSERHPHSYHEINLTRLADRTSRHETAPNYISVTHPRISISHMSSGLSFIPSPCRSNQRILLCQAFPRGKHFAVPTMPNISAVNDLGDFDITADRLAIIDGEG